MPNDIGIRCYKVLLNGVAFRKGFTGDSGKREAEALAERWQGSHSQGRGLLKHKDKGDYVEVVRDIELEKDYARRFDEAQRGNPQKLTVQYDSQHT